MARRKRYQITIRDIDGDDHEFDAETYDFGKDQVFEDSIYLYYTDYTTRKENEFYLSRDQFVSLDIQTKV